MSFTGNDGIAMKRRSATAFIITFSLLLCSTSVQSFDNLHFLFSVSRLSDGANLRDPQGLAVSRETGDILIADTGNDRLCILSAHGVLVKSVGRVAGIQSPIGAAFGKDEGIYLTEIGTRQIKRLSFNGSPLPPIVPQTHDETSPLPGRIIVDGKGNIYAADRAEPRVLIISGSDYMTRQIQQTPGSREPQWKVQDVEVDGVGNIYILSSQGLAVHVFDANGHHLRSFGQHGSNEDQFSFPTGVAIGPEGNLWIADSFRHEIKVFDPRGEFLSRWGITGMGDGELFYPIDIAFGKGILYVLEKGASRLQAFEISRKP
ncbi:NHL repeat-containing protein [Candidatus Poribacteria bacterium]|nr:NHL repeat-containing protein [Candidatus Poribacteria bacterium]